MKTGRTLQSLAAEIERQAASKKDFVADSRALTLVEDEQNQSVLLISGQGRFGITELCHEQIAGRLGIPQKYYDRMAQESSCLLRQNVNHWLQAKPEKRMVRTLDDRARAFLSERFRPLDNFDLAETVIPKIRETGCHVESCELTDRRLYIKAVTDRITGEIEKGDVVQAGVVVSNSEVGCGSVRIEPLLFRLVCSNGMIAND